VAGAAGKRLAGGWGVANNLLRRGSKEVGKEVGKKSAKALRKRQEKKIA
jgi:hypothetical protein